VKTKFLEKEFTYDGRQLRSLFGYLDHGLLGDSIIAWIGPCAIPFEHMVDGEDLREQAKIEGSKMVHFIVELFESTLFAGVNAQRLMASIVLEYLRASSSEQTIAASLRRDGDDIFAGDKKLSISIATVSPISTLIHFAVNISNVGTPVPTLSLEDLGVDAKVFAAEILNLFEKEMSSIREATRKVRWVK
jgi:uncharacterized protein